MNTIIYKGTGTVVTFDPDAETVTFVHSGMLALKKKRVASPWVVPVGAIEEIEWRESKGIRGAELRLLLRGRVGHDALLNGDLSGVVGNDKIGELVASIDAAVQAAEPVHDFGVSATPPQVPSTSVAREKKPSFMDSMNEFAEKNAKPLKFEGVSLKGGQVTFKGVSYPVAGAQAFVEVGGTQRRTTATRLVVGSAVTLGIGTLIGGMAKKKSNNIYVTVELADGEVILVEAKSKLEGDARKFVGAINSAARR